MQSLPLRCHRDDCNRPWAHISNGVLLVESVHGGHRHSNAVSLDTLLKLLQGSRMYKSEADIIKLLHALNLPVVHPVVVDVSEDERL